MKRILLTAGLLLLIKTKMFAQMVQFNPGGDSTSTFSVEGYVDTYFGFDFSEPEDANRAYFVSHSRHNEVNLNLAYISFKYQSENARAIFTPGFGTYMNSNYAAERVTLRNIVEASIGVKLFPGKNIWIDAGVIPSPYTNETAISFDQINYSRSFAPEYVPYYQTGARLTLPVTAKFNVYLYLLNGWQQIEDVNQPLAFGSQFEYKPTDELSLYLNTYYGNEKSVAAPSNGVRTFVDFYALYNKGRWNLAYSAYVGNQNRNEGSTNTDNYWGQTNVSAKYALTSKHSLSARVEYFNDPHMIMIAPVTGVQEFNCASYTLGYNIAITPKVQWRSEIRYFNSRDEMFIKSGAPVNNNALAITGLVAKF